MRERISRSFAAIDDMSQHSIRHDKFGVRNLLYFADLLFGDEA